MAERMVGKQAPDFTMEAVLSDKSFGKVSLEDIKAQDKWTVLFFYPMDFTFVCPTEITAMSDRYDEFEDLDAEVIGVSTDTIHTHLAWINTDRTQNGLGELKYQTVFDNNIGRDVDETLRVLQALQTGGLCPANWRPGQATL